MPGVIQNTGKIEHRLRTRGCGFPAHAPETEPFRSVEEIQMPKYDPNKYEFTIPIHLVPGMLQQIEVNKAYPRNGFKSVDGHLAAGWFVWRFRTQATSAPSNTPPPQVKTISPALGSQVSFLTFLEIQFDQAMTPPAETFPCLLSEPGVERFAHFIKIIKRKGKA